MICVPKEFEEEGNRLAEEYFASDSEIGFSNYVDQHASEEFDTPTAKAVGFLLLRPLHCPRDFSFTWSPQA